MVRTGLAVAGAALVLLGGAALTWGSTDEDAEPRVVDALAANRGVEVDSGSGDVEVRRIPGARAEVQQQVHRWWGGVFGDQQHYTVDRGQLRLDGDCGWNCSVSYVVTLPAPVPVTGELGSGGLDVAGMASVDTEVGSGSVRVHQVQGPVRARTGSGEIQLADLGDKVDVDTHSGEIEGRDIRGSEVHAHSGSGGVSLALSTRR